MRAGIVIVGGGAMGAFAAAELARRANPLRAPVVVLEAGSFEAAAPGTATLQPGTEADGALRPALVDGYGVLANFETQIGRGIGFGRPGLLDWTADAGASASDSEPGLRTAAHALGLSASLLKEANWTPDTAALDPCRLHAEVLALARTRGAITRACVEVQSLTFDKATGQICGLETSAGTYTADQVLICDLDAAQRLVPRAAPGMGESTRIEHHFSSPDFEDGPMALGELRGSAADLFETDLTGASADPLSSLFGAGETLEYPFPCVRTKQFEVLPNPLDRRAVVVERNPSQDTDSMLAALSRLAPAFESFAAQASMRAVRVTTSADGNPVVGCVPGSHGVFVALGLGHHAAQVAAGLAPGVAAQMRGDVVTAFDTALFAVR